MFGVGFQEMLLVGLFLLVLFGPKRLPEMARDIGSFASKAQHTLDEFKADLASDVEEDRNPKRNPGTRQVQELEKNQESTLRRAHSGPNRVRLSNNAISNASLSTQSSSAVHGWLRVSVEQRAFENALH